MVRWFMHRSVDNKTERQWRKTNGRNVDLSRQTIQEMKKDNKSKLYSLKHTFFLYPTVIDFN